MTGQGKRSPKRTASRRAYRGSWVAVETAAALCGTSVATVKGWIRRGVVATSDNGGVTMLRLDQVVTRAVGSRRQASPATLPAQAEAALNELEIALRDTEKLRVELASAAEEFAALQADLTRLAKRESWERTQHEREVRDAYARWEQERASWQREREQLVGEIDTRPLGIGPHPVDAVPVNHAQLTSRQPVDDDVLPPLHAPAPSPEELLDQGIIAPVDRVKRRWRRDD